MPRPEDITEDLTDEQEKSLLTNFLPVVQEGGCSYGSLEALQRRTEVEVIAVELPSPAVYEIDCWYVDLSEPYIPTETQETLKLLKQNIEDSATPNAFY